MRVQVPPSAPYFKEVLFERFFYLSLVGTASRVDSSSDEVLRTVVAGSDAQYASILSAPFFKEALIERFFLF